jgi:hypothetical protein
MFQELDVVALTHNIEEYGLKKDDVGTIVHCYSDGQAFEVEFVTSEGETIALLTLKPADIRPLRGREVLHVRELEPVAA